MLGRGMTSRELLRLVLRRWYLLIAGVALTGVVIWPAAHQPGVYWAQVDVVILPPTDESFPNKLEDPEVNLTALAGVVVADFNRGSLPLLTASADTTLYGEGKRDAIEVRMPNMGNQWTPLYTTPTIDLQVVGGDEESVRENVVATVGELRDLLAVRQQTLGVVSSARATMLASPNEPSVQHVTGSRARVAAAGGTAGIALTIAAIYWFEQLVAKRDRPLSSGTPKQQSTEAGRRSTINRRASY